MSLAPTLTWCTHLDGMPFAPPLPQLIEVRGSTVGALEHKLQVQPVEELRSPPRLRLRIDLPFHEVNRPPEHTLFSEARDDEDEPPEWTPEVPEEIVDEGVPRTRHVPEPGESGNGLRCSLGHVATSLLIATK